MRAWALFLAERNHRQVPSDWWFRCSCSANQLEPFCRNPASTEQSASPVTYGQTRLINRVDTKGLPLDQLKRKRNDSPQLFERLPPPFSLRAKGTGETYWAVPEAQVENC